MESIRGQLLIASPSLVDANFRRTVVLVAEHSDDGAMGIVLNRPATAVVTEAVPQLADLVDADARVHVGGPVEPGAVVVLAEFERSDDAAAIVFDGIGFMSADADPNDIAEATHRARVFAGYAGWGAGQLDGELEHEDWIVASARPEDVFTSAPERLWSQVLRRKGGQYAILALMPPDPSVN